MDEFQYHEKWKNPKTGRYIRHVYTLNGKPLKGITTVLDVISKPALYQWYANMVAKEFGWLDARYSTQQEISDRIEDVLHDIKLMNPSEYAKFVELSRNSASKSKDNAADVGTVAHKMVEIYVDAKIAKIAPVVNVNLAIEGVIADGKKVSLTESEKEIVLGMFSKFFNWAETNNVVFLASERKLYSKTHWIAGTCDLVFMIDGKKFVGDVKTYSGIYDRTPFFQCAGYRIMLEEAGEKDFVGSTIIRLGKDGSFEVKTSYDYETDKAGFLAALTLVKALDTYKK